MPKRDYRFPWRENNRFTLLSDGEQYFPRMLEAIRSAQSYVLLEMYLVESGAVLEQFMEAIADLPRRVEVYLLLDDFGAQGLHLRDRVDLVEKGVRLVFYNPLRYGRLHRNLVRDHRKILVVDGRIAYVGGMGITDEFAETGNPDGNWHELVVEIEGECVNDWQILFQEVWDRWSKLPLELQSCQVISEGVQKGRVVIGQGVQQAEMQRSLLSRLHRARFRVWIATAYFVPSWKVRRALRHAARKGIDVRLLLPGPHTDHPAVRHAGRRFYLRMLRSGVRVFEYQPRFIHAKAMLCDDWASIGSSNIDRWNLRWNLEANQEVDDPEFARIVESQFNTDFQGSREYTLEEWRTRSWYRRMLEWFWGKVDCWLERLSRR